MKRVLAVLDNDTHVACMAFPRAPLMRLGLFACSALAFPGKTGDTLATIAAKALDLRLGQWYEYGGRLRYALRGVVGNGGRGRGHRRRDRRPRWQRAGGRRTRRIGKRLASGCRRRDVIYVHGGATQWLDGSEGVVRMVWGRPCGDVVVCVEEDGEMCCAAVEGGGTLERGVEDSIADRIKRWHFQKRRCTGGRHYPTADVSTSQTHRRSSLPP